MRIASIQCWLLFFLSGVGFSSVEFELDATLNYITGEQGSYANEQGKRTFSFEHLYIRGLLNVLSLHQVYYCIRSNIFWSVSRVSYLLYQYSFYQDILFHCS